MKIISIKKLVLALIVGLGSVMTLPAYAWPDTDEMNMCGTAVKKVRAYGSDHRGWAARDNYVKHRGNNYYYRANCPESKATKNYKGKDWTPKAKMVHKHKAKIMHKALKHDPNHKNHADCIRTDRLNMLGLTGKNLMHRVHKITHKKVHKVDHNFYHQAQAVLNMSKVKRVNVVHNPKHKNHADCVRTDGLNSSGAIIRVKNRKHH